MANPFWRNESLETYLDRWATERPDKTAIVDGRGRYTYAQVARDVETADGFLKHQPPQIAATIAKVRRHVNRERHPVTLEDC